MRPKFNSAYLRAQLASLPVGRPNYLTLRALNRDTRLIRLNGDNELVLQITCNNRNLPQILKELGIKGSQDPASPFLQLCSIKTGEEITLKYPNGSADSFKTLAEVMREHPLYSRDRSPLHFEDVAALTAPISLGIEKAEQAHCTLRLSADGIIAQEYPRTSSKLGFDSRDWRVYIADISGATKVNQPQKASSIRTDYRRISPEEIETHLPSQHSDRYQLGIIFYALLTGGRHPASVIRKEYSRYFELKRRFNELTAKGIRNGEYKQIAEELNNYDSAKLPPRNWESMSEKEQALYLAKEAVSRMNYHTDSTLNQRLLNEPKFLREEVYDLLKSLLETAPDKRISPAEFNRRIKTLEKRYLVHINETFGGNNVVYHAGKRFRSESQLSAIGLGGTAKVSGFEAIPLNSGLRTEEFAIKAALVERDAAGNPTPESQLFIDAIENERNILKFFSNKSKYFITLISKDQVKGNLPDHPHYLILPRLKGGDLEARIKKTSEMDSLFMLNVIVNVFTDISQTVQIMHQEGYVHRDLKPENIGFMNNGYGEMRFMDLGLAHRTDTDITQICGSPAYMSPEQIGSVKALPAFDVYALGMTMLEVLRSRGAEESHKATLINGNSIVEIYRNKQALLATIDQNNLIDNMLKRFHSLVGDDGKLNDVGKQLEIRFKNLFWGMLAFEVNERWSMDQVVAEMREIRTIIRDHA